MIEAEKENWSKPLSHRPNNPLSLRTILRRQVKRSLSRDLARRWLKFRLVNGSFPRGKFKGPGNEVVT